MVSAIEYIGLDIGQAKVGFARGNSAARLAEPLFTVPTTEALDKLAKLVDKLSAKAVVAGLPRNLSGEDTAQTVWVREWVDDAKAKLKLAFYWQDEALSTKMAEERKLRDKQSPVDEDALAAAIILQDFLDSSDSERALA